MRIEIDAEIAMEVASHEGIVLETYLDSEGVRTWSVGITSASGHNVDRYWNKPSSMQRAIDVWVWLLQRYADDVRAAFGDVELTKAQFAAALSFHWNTGAIFKAGWVKAFKRGDTNATIRSKFMEWNKPASITERRRREADLFLDGTWSGDSKINWYQRLTKAHTPQWSSVKRVSIATELEHAFGNA